MQINSIQKYSTPQNKNNVGFKSVYPIYHWLAEGGKGSYAPVMTEDLTRTLGRKMVKYMNTNSSKKAQEITEALRKSNVQANLREVLNMPELIAKLPKQLQKMIAEFNMSKRVKLYLSRNDADFLSDPIARIFYNPGGGINDGKKVPIAYLMTGKDVRVFEDNFAKPIGKTLAKGLKGSAEEKILKTNYWQQGFNFIKNRKKLFKLSSGEPAELHVKLETVRAKTGNLKGYNVVNMKYFPQDGLENPFVLSEWIK